MSMEVLELSLSPCRQEWIAQCVDDWQQSTCPQASEHAFALHHPNSVLPRHQQDISTKRKGYIEKDRMTHRGRAFIKLLRQDLP